MSNSPRGIVIAGTHSGCGKTSVALGLMSALSRRGMDIRPFKVGPDFIDPGHHALAAQRASHNLDGWMLDKATVQDIFSRYALGGDVAVVEGVMGLHDGASGSDEQGSTAQLAKWLGLPVVLVADVRSMARSAAALVQGYLRFDPQLKCAGVILNRTGSERHRALLREAMESAGVPLLGCLPRSEGLELPSRHLGLVTAGEGDGGMYARLADWLEEHLDLDLLLQRIPAAHLTEVSAVHFGSPQVRIGVAKDEAFCFVYGENLRLLEAAGAELVFFSPLQDQVLPDGLGGLYLPGGYPELHADRLEKNGAMCEAVRQFCVSGRPVYAECGGLLYLLDELTGLDQENHEMCGVYPASASMRGRFAALGYREVRTRIDTLLGPAGSTVRGHEFHYSTLVGADALENAYTVTDRTGGEVGTGGFVFGNVLGSYVHLHFASNPHLAGAFVAACSKACK